jgi:hypothetical protein
MARTDRRMFTEMYETVVSMCAETYFSMLSGSVSLRMANER